MKKFISVLAMLLVMAVSAKAMSYEQARQQALFLTDKMAYELNLSDAQYEAAYEVNLDYLMGINTYDDLYGSYWEQRNLDLSYILLDWQYRSYVAASYFYRPLYWDAGYWHFGIYARYPHRDYFFFYDRPRVFMEYHGGHSWKMNGGRSWYNGRDFGRSNSAKFSGLRDGFNRGDFGQGKRVSFGARRSSSTSNSSFGNNSRTQQSTRSNSSFGTRQSSTRTTVGRSSGSTSSSFGHSPSSTFTPKLEATPSKSSSSTFGSGRSTQQTQRSTTSTPSRVSSPSLGTSRSSSSSFGSNRGSFGGSSSSGSSFGGGSRSSSSGHSSTGGSFGSRR
jgi:hypothetical protein